MGKIVSKATDALGITDSAGVAQAAAQGQALTRDQMRRLQAIDLPDIEKMKVALQSPELVGLLNAQEMGPSEMEEISLDPRLREAQMEALAEFKEQGKVGLTAQDRAQLNEMRREEAARSEAQQQGILRQMAERGALDSGMQLAAQLAAQQGSAQRRAEGVDRMAAQAATQRQNALGQAANLAGNIGQQQFAQQAQQASAADRIAQFNAANRQNVQAQNLAARQQIANQQASLANQQQMYNKGLQQQQFQNELSKAGAVGQAAGNLAGQFAQQAAAKQQAGAQMMGAIVGGAGAIAKSDRNLKKNIQPASADEAIERIQEMLDELKASKYNYKEESGMDDDDYMGVMAQDLEKSPLGSQFVEEDEDGDKMVDYGQMQSTQLAALADIHSRLKKLEGEE